MDYCKKMMDSKCCRITGGIFMGLLAVSVIVFFAASACKDFKLAKYAGKAPVEQKTIVIDGTGKVTAVPDIGTVDVGFVTEGKDVQTIQKTNVDKMNALIAELKKLGIDSKDIQTTQYQVYPKYDYTNGKSTLSGYSINQSVTVKIRDLNKISDVLAKAGASGANQVGGLNFTMDDPENLKVQARNRAILNAESKARMLANSLGIKLGRIVGFNENSSQPYPTALYKTADGFGIGGGASAAPQVETGSLDITSNVSITYEIGDNRGWGWEKGEDK